MAKESKENYLEKLEYLNLDLEKIPKILKDYEPLEFRISKTYDEIQYKQYRYIQIKDIQILLSPTNRMDDLEKKYKNASNISEFLDNKNEKNIIKHTTFLNMLKKMNIKEIEKIEKEQNELNKKVPFKVKFEGNYLWQIYYSENTDKYFMIVPVEDTDYSTFFYLLKKQLESKKTSKIFVPIRNVEYSTKYLKKSEYDDIGNYLWLFTKDWALIYDVYDKSNKLSIQIVGEAEVYGKIRSPYKIQLSEKEEALKLYKLLKAMFILQTELHHYFKFRTSIDKKGSLEFYHEEKQVKYEEIINFINEEFEKSIEKKKEVKILIEKYKKMLEENKLEQVKLEIEYLAKEKQISTFLECKKSFFGKVKYFFKYNKKKNKSKIQGENLTIKEELKELNKKEEIKKEKEKKENYTIEELVESYKEYEIKEIEMKNILMDLNALKLKMKNTKKKIENASAFIKEIDNHKKSIFEFWKYSNKDEVATLAEGESEQVNIIKKVTKNFDYEEDIEKFGETLDKIQRKKLTREETDSIYITTTNEIEILNKIKNNEVLPKDIEQSLKKIKKEAKEGLIGSEDFDIFGGMIDDNTKIKMINNKKHRELPKDKFKILEVNKNSKQIGFKLTLERIVENIKNATEKIELQEDIAVYKTIIDDKLNENNINLFNINPESEIKSVIKQEDNKINLYKINLKKGTKVIGYTNSIYYDNQNKTLPIGMNLGTKILVDVAKLQLEQTNKRIFNISEFEDEKDDFANINIKTITVYEYN